MAKTLRDQLITALEARGEKVVPSRTGKAVTMTRTPPSAEIAAQWAEQNDGKPLLWFIGANGSLRSGISYSTSIPQDRTKRVLLGGA